MMTKNKLDHLYQGGVLNFAHRGASHNAPENTLAAFRLAREMGADGVELDVQASKDGEAVVIHDFTVDATTDGQGPVKNKTLAELKELDAGSWFDARFAGERIPTLQEVIVEVGHQLLLNIELKARVFGNADLIAEVVRLIEDHNLVHRTMVSSFNPFALRQVKRLNPRISTGVLYHSDLSAHLIRALLLFLTDPDALNPEKRLVTREYMDWAKERGYRVNAWMVDEPTEMKRLIALGVDGIITNRPDVLREILDTGDWRLEEIMSKRLIVNADDYGLTRGVTRGIIQAHREGIVTSTTVMMNMPQVEDALGLAGDCPDLGMGVHLVFTAWRPLLPAAEVPSLVDEDGYFHSQEAILSHPERIDTGELKAELSTQIERFRASGREPDHLDCHHFVHLYPPFFAVYVELAEEYDLPMRLPLPPEEEWGEVAASTALVQGLPPDFLQEIARQDIGLVQVKGIPHPDRFVQSFYGEEALTLENLLSILNGLPEGISELMTHPGLADEKLLEKSTYAKERERELELLCHPRVKERIGELGIELINFGVLKQR